MSLVISSDILAGVLAAAPATASRRATERLERLAGVDASGRSQAATGQQQMWERYIDPASSRDGLDSGTTPRSAEYTEPAPTPTGAHKLACDAYRGFESMMLRNMFEELLPAAEEGNYGSGLSGRMWRSMVADSFASLYTTAGGIGISKMLAGNASPVEVPETDASDHQWPYFRSAAITPFSARS